MTAGLSASPLLGPNAAAAVSDLAATRAGMATLAADVAQLTSHVAALQGALEKATAAMAAQTTAAMQQQASVTCQITYLKFNLRIGEMCMHVHISRYMCMGMTALAAGKTRTHALL